MAESRNNSAYIAKPVYIKNSDVKTISGKFTDGGRANAGRTPCDIDRCPS